LADAISTIRVPDLTAGTERGGAMRRLRVMYLALGCLMAFTGACGGSSGHKAGNSDAKSKSGATAGGVRTDRWCGGLTGGRPKGSAG